MTAALLQPRVSFLGSLGRSRIRGQKTLSLPRMRKVHHKDGHGHSVKMKKKVTKEIAKKLLEPYEHLIGHELADAVERLSKRNRKIDDYRQRLRRLAGAGCCCCC
jgi:hypothetical protein